MTDRVDADDLLGRMHRENELRWDAHVEDHKQLALSVKVGLDAVERERALHVIAHDAAHEAHNREHTLNQKAVDAQIESHATEHRLEASARDKAEVAVDRRLEGMNEVRSQLREQAATFARLEALNSLTDRVIAIEKLDIKGEGKSAGQGLVIAAIVGSVSFVATVLTVVIVVTNLVT